MLQYSSLLFQCLVVDTLTKRHLRPDYIAVIFESIAVAEEQHEKRFLDLAKNIKEDKVFKRDEKVVWRCRNCGYLHTGTEPSEVCPACAHSRAHFELLGENY